MNETVQFPDGFAWGSATSAFQIEGATHADDKSESIWDRFAATPGAIKDGATGEQACGHYDLWRSDVEQMAAIGLNSYRFSISWPRIIPTGVGSVNEAGLAWYSRLVDGLVEAGIDPWVTLYHWDLPQILETDGGWTNRSTVGAFVEYTRAVVERLGDRVTNWTTINEPWVVADHGYDIGQHAPGRTGAGVVAGHHMLLAHAAATNTIREISPTARVGLVVNLSPQIPMSENEADAAACVLADGTLNRWYLDPVCGRGYPSDVVEHFGIDQTHVLDGDLDSISEPTDFLGINYYSRNILSAARDDAGKLSWERVPVGPQTEIGWDIYPDGLTQTLERVHRDYGFAEYHVTECGAAFDDHVDDGGKVDDQPRIEFLHQHFAATLRAIEAGVPVAGFFVWSLLDNFEWAEGFTKRFGLIHVDFSTLVRTPKASCAWLSKVIAANAIEPATIEPVAIEPATIEPVAGH